MICRMINAVGIVIFIAFVCIASVEYTSEVSDDISSATENIYNNKLSADVCELEKRWKKYSSYLSLFVDHNELEEINRLIIDLKETDRESDYVFRMNCREITLAIDHIKENQLPKFNNIF